jgi:hypothetical protein
MKKNPRRSGQSLIEALVALSILTVGFMGIMTLLTKSYQLNRTTSDDTQGTYLASEGIEIAKNLIDHDVYQGIGTGGVDQWGACFGLGAGQDGHYELAYDSTTCAGYKKTQAQAQADHLHIIDLNNDTSTPLYTYNATGKVTEYTRDIHVSAPSDNELDVQSTVTWRSGNLSNIISVEDHFYKWHPNFITDPSTPTSGGPGGPLPTSTPPGAVTTLLALTSNNTSAANSFLKNWSNNDENAGNISKVDIHTLLYPGNTTKIFALVEPWFCTKTPGEVSNSVKGNDECMSHLQQGNNENTVAYVDSMVNDMISRGIDGATCDFEGVGTSGIGDGAKQQGELGVCDKTIAATAASGKLMMDAMEDSASWKYECAVNDEACILAQMKRDLTHIATYYALPSYRRVGGKPVLLFFLDESGQVPMWASIWTQLKAWAVTNAGDPLFVQQRQLLGGSNDSGMYDWPSVGPNTDEPNWSTNGTVLGFLSNIAGPDKGLAVREGAAFKGFNDTLADWSGNRIIEQNCGQTWANGIWNAPAMRGFNASNQLPSILIATWSDYEEGTEIESGIDNCLSISDSVSGNTLNWSITGQANTLDHYTIYSSTDGVNLTVLDNVLPSVNSVNLATYNLPSASYKIYVQAVGKPSILNHLSGGATYNN